MRSQLVAKDFKEDFSTFYEFSSKPPYESSLAFNAYNTGFILKAKSYMKEYRLKQKISSDLKNLFEEAKSNFLKIDPYNFPSQIKWFLSHKKSHLIPVFEHWFEQKNINSDDGLFCDQSARIMNFFLQQNGMLARFVNVEGEDGPGNWSHVFLEIFNPRENHWIYFDPHYLVTFPHSSFFSLKEKLNVTNLDYLSLRNQIENNSKSFFKVQSHQENAFLELFKFSHKIVRISYPYTELTYTE